MTPRLGDNQPMRWWSRPVYRGPIGLRILLMGIVCAAFWALVRFSVGRANDGTGVPLRATPPLVELTDQTIDFEAELLGEARMFVGQPLPGKTAYWMRLEPFRKEIVFARPGLSCAGVIEAHGRVLRREATESAPVAHQVDAESVRCRERH
jgi:hypothetical protein